jgi:hypothetical protein
MSRRFIATVTAIRRRTTPTMNAWDLESRNQSRPTQDTAEPEIPSPGALESLKRQTECANMLRAGASPSGSAIAGRATRVAHHTSSSLSAERLVTNTKEMDVMTNVCFAGVTGWTAPPLLAAICGATDLDLVTGVSRSASGRTIREATGLDVTRSW